MNKLFALICLILFSAAGMAQEVITSDDHLVNGFEKKLSGDDITYHSPIPSVDKAMLVRSTNGRYTMEWQTEKIPSTVKEKYVTIAWLAGIGSSPGAGNMTLAVNGAHQFTFRIDGKKDWKIKGPNGSELLFHSDMEDQNGDNFGFMFLRIPASSATKGQPITIKVTGANEGKNTWYMTFQMPVRTGLTIQPFPAIIKDGEKKLQLVSGNLLYFGAPTTAKVYANGQLIKEQPIKFGSNYIRMGVEKVTKKKNVTFKLVAGSFERNTKVLLQPVRPWQVNLVQHSHTDIGYTRSQTEILAEHLRYIDYALDYCDATDSYPDAAKFRWTCEAAWAVDEYIKCRPAEQVERFKKRIKEGRIEVAAMYFNFDELPEEQVLAASLQPLKRFKEQGIDTKMAMQNDVNGIAWCMNDFYHDLGVKYLNMGTHGHRALICFDKPTLFWWESPSGNRMLAYRSEHYDFGNFQLDLYKNDIPSFETKVLNYLTSLEHKNYQFNTISIQHSGYTTDNSPPSTISSELVRKWNEMYEWPKLKTTTPTQFFEEMESKYAKTLPVYRGAWPDWWTDGFGASAREVAAVRKAQSNITANSAGLAMAKIQGSPLPSNVDERIDLVNNALMFYTEHTVGYSESVREPYHEQTMEQRAIKESYAWEAFRRARMVGEETMGLLQSHINKEQKPSLVVYNSLSWKRDGLLKVYIDHQLVPRNSQPTFTDKAGNSYPAQTLGHRSDGTYWAIWVKDIPAFGYKKLVIDHTNGLTGSTTQSATTQMENQWYKITVDPAKGFVSSWFDKEMNKELIDKAAKHSMGEFIYERLGNRSQMEQKRMTEYKRYSLDTAWFDSYSEGPVWNTILLKGRTAASYEGYDVNIEVRLFNTTKRVDMTYSIVKKPIVDPEGIYIAFPFKVDNGKLYFEVQGGLVEAGKDQIPGSSNDWNTVQNYAALRSNSAQVIVGSPEIPLMQFGGINTGRYKAGALPETSHMYSWPMNNYWVTNFNPDQKGEHQWSYYLTSSNNASNVEASRFGWGARVPFLTRVLPGGGQGDKVWEKSIIAGWPENVLLVNALPTEAKNAVILQVRETEGKQADLSALKQTSGAPFTIKKVDAVGNDVQNGTSVLKALESGFYMLTW